MPASSVSNQHLYTGKKAEDIALEYLEGKGLKLVERNFSSAYGEIDLVMNEKKSTVFVEVRYRKNNAFGSAADTVDQRKQSKLAATAALWLQKNKKAAKHPCRFDVISITGQLGQGDIQWITNAFEVS
ncbi:MAG: YraN family protein [Gammaproteobacteria bacterium]|nr:YraN family protein [Gammaproteobacteria bacterium]